MRVAIAQLTSGSDPVGNLELLTRTTKRAAAAGAALVVFPEAMMRAFGASLTEIAEPLDGPWASGVRATATAHDIVVIAGMFTPAPAGRVRNTVLVTGPGIDASYDKIHLFDAYGFAESDTVEPGDRLLTFELAGMTIGVATCYDIRFPQLFRSLAAAGAQTIVVPSSWGAGEGKAEAFQLLARARALDSTCYVVACDQADPLTQGIAVGRAPTGVGHSLLAGPDGSVLARAGGAPELLIVDLDAERVAEVRRALPVLANARDV